MSDWQFAADEVLEDTNGYWWHVANRYTCEDTGERLYRLWDGTHTADDYVPAAVVEESYESLGWSTDTKPAHEHGYRVNGILTEPANVDCWLGQECKSDHNCPVCAEPTVGKADLIYDLVNREVSNVKIICGACGNTTQVDPDTPDLSQFGGNAE